MRENCATEGYRDAVEQTRVTPDPEHTRLHGPRNIGLIEDSMHADDDGGAKNLGSAPPMVDRAWPFSARITA